MEQVLPPLFIAIAALALSLAIYAVWQSLRGLFAEDHGLQSDSRRSERARLVDEKTALLQTLKDIRFEREVGKISDQDFEALNARYRGRAKQVLRDLDKQLGPYRGQAEALVDAAITGKSTAEPARGAKKKPSEKSASAPASKSEASARVCPACETENDTDAAFCKACGKRFESDPSAKTSDPAAAEEEA